MAVRNKITPRALMEIKMPGEVQIAPDGSRIAFSVSETDWDANRTVQHLYVVPTDGKTAARQVTRGQAEESEPRWAPDGKWLAFLAARDEGAEDDADYDDEEDAPKPQVWLLPMDGLGGEAEKLTDAPEGVSAYDWLPDGTGIVYLAREPRPGPLERARADRHDRKDDAVVEREEKFRQQIWRIGLEERKAVLLHAGDYGIGEIAVSPDGRWIAFTTNYTGEENDYHLVDVWALELATAKTTQLTNGPGGKFHPVWTVDSQAVLYCQSRDPELSFSQENLYQVGLAERQTACLTETFPDDLTGWRGVWCDRVEAIYVSAATGTTTAIYRRAPETGRFELASEDDAHIHDFHVSPDGGLAYVSSGAADAPEVLWRPAGARESEVLTDLNGDWAVRYEVAPTELIRYPSADGLEIEALLTLPPESHPADEPFPCIVNLHGGPHGRVAQALTPFSLAQVWASEGYAVLSPNYRGSEGYGDEFGLASRGDLGGGDLEDVLSGVDWAVAEGVADAKRLGLIGSSYGAFLVNAILGRDSRFGAAVSQFGIFSLATDFSNSQAPRWDAEYLGGPPWEVRELYERLSPASRVAEIRTPVLIMHGEGDGNTFIANSQEMYQALRLLGRTVEFVRYPREGHGFFEPQHRLDEMRRTIAWFDRHLSPAGSRDVYRIGERITRDGWELTVAEATLPSYVGTQTGRTRFLEVALALRDTAERRLAFTLRPNDLWLTPANGSREISPAGVPVEALGGKALARGRGWKFSFEPGKDERGVVAAMSVAFPISKRGGTYQFHIKDFPPVQFDVPEAEEKTHG